MADSRTASSNRLRKVERKVAIQSKVIAFLISILLSLLFVNLIREPDFTTPQIYVLFLLFFAIGLWVTEAIPPFAVGIMIVGFLVFFLGNPTLETEYNLDVGAFVHTWSDSVIWLLLGGFFLAEGMRKTGLDLDLFKFTTKRFGRNPKHLTLALMVATAVASMFISNTATTAMMFAAIMPLLETEGNQSNLAKIITISIPAAASIGGMGTIIGSPPNAIAADMINNLPNSTYNIGFLEWMIFGIPVVAVLILIMWFALLRKYNIDGYQINLTSLDSTPESVDQVVESETKLKKMITLTVLGVTLLLWLTEKIHPIPVAAVSGIPIICLTMLGIINNQDVRQLPWDTLMLVAGGLSLGLAIQQTGLSAQFVEMIKGFHVESIVLMIIFSIATVFFSNVMSNTATVTILIPAAALLTGVDPISLALIIGLSASCALFLPVSTPPNAIAYSTGLIEQSQFRLGGLLVGLGGPVLIILWVLLLR